MSLKAIEMGEADRDDMQQNVRALPDHIAIQTRALRGRLWNSRSVAESKERVKWRCLRGEAGSEWVVLPRPAVLRRESWRTFAILLTVHFEVVSTWDHSFVDSTPNTIAKPPSPTQYPPKSAPNKLIRLISSITADSS